MMQDRVYQIPVREVAYLTQRLIDTWTYRKALWTMLLMNGARDFNQQKV